MLMLRKSSQIIHHYDSVLLRILVTPPEINESTMEQYWWLGLAMALLSIWKTYTGPALAALVGFSYLEMLFFNALPAILAGYIGWLTGRYSYWFYSSKALGKFRPRLRRFIQSWNRYGNHLMALLAPVLVGIPLYTLIARRIREPHKNTFLLLTASILWWSGLSFGLVSILGESTHLDLSDLNALIDRLTEQYTHL